MMKKASILLFLFLMFASMFLVGCNGNPFAGSHVVSFDPNNGDETVNILVKDGRKAKAPSVTCNENGMPFMEWRADDGKAFDLETPISSDIGLRAAYYQKMTPEADFESQCIGWISSGFYWGVCNHLEELIDTEKLLKPMDADDASEFVPYQGENITKIEYVLSNVTNLSAIQHVLGILFISNGAKDEVSFEFTPVRTLTEEVLTLDIGGTTYVFALDLDLFKDPNFNNAIEEAGWKPFTDLEDKTTYEGNVGKLYYVDRKTPNAQCNDLETMKMEGFVLKIHVKQNERMYDYEISINVSACESAIDMDNVYVEHSTSWSLSLDDEPKPPVKYKTHHALGRPYKYEAFYMSFYAVENITMIM